MPGGTITSLPSISLQPMKYSTSCAAILSVFTLITTLGVEANASSPTTQVQSPQPTAIAQLSRRRLNWRVGVRSGRYHIGGFSRSSACASPIKMIPFVPPARADERIGSFKAPVDLTVSSRPTFWVYVSSIPKATEMQFTLQNESGDQELYTTQFTVDQAAGLIGVRLPKTVPELEAGANYYWEMSMKCPDNADSTTLITANGWVQRVNPQQMKATPTFDPKLLVRDLAKASEIDKPAIYAALGVWQDAVTSLIDLQQKQPNNRELKEDWRTLLTGAEMSQFINVPILAVN